MGLGDRPTIRDVAREAGVSVSAVHLVLQQKPGVSEATRQHVRDVALSLGYQPNTVAASLKRKGLSIAVVLPARSSKNRYYFSYQWDAVRDCIEDLRDYNMRLIAAPYYESMFVPQSLLETLLEEQRPDGIICAGFLNEQCVTILRKFHDAVTPVVLLGVELRETQRLLCVSPPYEVIGAMLAEQLLLQTAQQSGRYLIATGSPELASHFLVYEGFSRFFAERGLQDAILPVAAESYSADSKAHFVRALKEEKCIGCCAVSARDSLTLADALVSAGVAGSIPAIGSDLFPQSVQYLKSGVFNGILNKSPYQQAWVAAQYLTDYLLHSKTPARDSVTIGGELVLSSNLSLYDNGFYRRLL